MSKSEKVSITPFQIFTLSYLYSLELDSQDSRIRRFDGINVRTLVTILPQSIISDDLTTKEIVKQLELLEGNGLIDVGMLGSSEENFGSFVITTEGILLVKNILGNIKHSLKNKKKYEKTIDGTEGDTDTKKWLKGIWDKLRDKSQDQIADAVLSQVKIYGPQLIGFLIRFLPNGS